MGRYTNGSCITDMQLELKKEIEHAEICLLYTSDAADVLRV